MSAFRELTRCFQRKRINLILIGINATSNTVRGGSAMTNDDRHDDQLSALSCHYDSMLWTVTSLWAGAIGGLLVYCTSSFDIWLSLMGLGLTVVAMAFAASFRDVRGRLIDTMSCDLAAFHRSQGGFKQWPWFLVVFLLLVITWIMLLIKNERTLWWLWIILGEIACVGVAHLWSRGRPNPSKEK